MKKQNWLFWIGAALVLGTGGVYVLKRVRKAQQAGNVLVQVTPRDAAMPAPPVPAGAESEGSCTEVTAHDKPQEGAVEAQMKNTDPRAAGWTTEIYSDEAGKRLKKLAAFLVQPSEAKLLDEVKLGEGSASDALRTEGVKQVYEKGGMTVRRGIPAAGSPRGGLKAALEALAATLPGGKAERAEVKIVHVEEAGDFFTTRVRVEINAADGKLRREITTHWLVKWKLAEGLPFLSLAVADYEEVDMQRDGGALFEEVTEAVLGKTPAYLPLVQRGLDYWGQRMCVLNNLQYDGHNGFAVGDANGDGLDDLYVCDNGGLANQLYIHQPDGTVKETAHEAGVDWLENSRSALFVDLDNDGDQDLVIATISLVFFMENDGTGHFKQAGGVRGIDYPFSMAAADYDNDGLLDIYVCNYSARPDDASFSGGRLPTPYNDARNGGKNVIFRNHGGWKITNVTAECGLDQNNDRWSFAAAWDDFDNDGDQDLYVSNDFGRNNLYRNDDGHFTDIAAEAGVEDAATGMSAAWGDYNRDGNMDIYVGNMFSAAGNRVTFQRKFTDARKDAGEMQRMARGNTLFAGDGHGGFKDVSAETNVLMGRWSWGSIFVDLNNDGWQDIFVANGYLSNRKADDL